MEKVKVKEKETFDPKKSIKRTQIRKIPIKQSRFVVRGYEYVWASKLERVHISREGVSYASIEEISKRLNIPVKNFLQIIGIPRATYSKKHKEESVLNGRDSELILILAELIDFGVEVFNQEEEKFQRWLKKENISLGGNSPESLLDSITGIQEVRNCLNRIEYGNFA